VSCNLSGLNSFFVRRDVASEFTSYTPSELYQPRRPNLTRLDSVLPPTLNWLRDETARHRNTGIDQVTDN
jgi:hypothetical protein